MVYGWIRIAKNSENYYGQNFGPMTILRVPLYILSCCVFCVAWFKANYVWPTVYPDMICWQKPITTVKKSVLLPGCTTDIYMNQSSHHATLFTSCHSDSQIEIPRRNKNHFTKKQSIERNNLYISIYLLLEPT